MTPERIGELLQILWNEVDSADDLHAFVQKYGHELDRSFLMAIADAGEQATNQGNRNAAVFFMQVGQAILQMLLPEDDDDDEYDDDDE